MVNWAKTSLQVQRPIGEGLLWHLKRLLDSLLNLLKLEPEFWIYGLVRVLGPVSLKLILPPQIPRWRFMLTFEELECDSTLNLGENEIFFWQLELRFWIYGLTKTWGSIDPNVVITLQILGWRLILIFGEFIRFTFWFWI